MAQHFTATQQGFAGVLTPSHLQAAGSATSSCAPAAASFPTAGGSRRMWSSRWSHQPSCLQNPRPQCSSPWGLINHEWSAWFGSPTRQAAACWGVPKRLYCEWMRIASISIPADRSCLHAASEAVAAESGLECAKRNDSKLAACSSRRQEACAALVQWCCASQQPVRRCSCLAAESCGGDRWTLYTRG